MLVKLFRELREDNFVSMEVYARGLIEALTRVGSEKWSIQPVVSFEDQSLRILRRLFGQSKFVSYYSRYVAYPRQTTRQQGDINHIIASAYGHLVHHLDASRTVVTCHDLMPLKLEEGVVPVSSYFRPGLFLAKYAYSGMVKASKIIADSESTKRDIEKYFGCVEKIRVIHPGVASIYSVADEQEKLESAGRFSLNRHGVHYLLHVGGVGNYKNIDGLLRTFAILVRDLQLNAYLVRVGTTMTSVQRLLATNLGVLDRLIELGSLSDNDLRVVYNLADVLVFPSHYEGYGLPVHEAMACGTPVVVSTAPSLLEVAGDAALAVASNDHRGLAEAVQALLTNQELRARMIAEGLKRAKMFSWDKAAAQVFDVYRETLDFH